MGKPGKTLPWGADGFQSGVSHTMQAGGADGAAFPALAQMELSGRAPLSEGTSTLELTPLTAHSLGLQRNFSAPRAEAPSDPAPPARPYGGSLAQTLQSSLGPPATLASLTSSSCVLQDPCIHTAINDKVATSLHQDFILQTHSPSAPRTMSSATQRQGRWRCLQASTGD